MARVATVITDLFEDVEFTSPRDALVEAGHEVITIGPEARHTAKGKKGNAEVTIDKGIKDVTADDFDALLIPGGFSPDSLRKDDRIVDFVKDFAVDRKPIFSICHAPQLLVTAEILNGKDITCVKQVIVDVKNAGANYYDKEVVIDSSGLISSRTPDDLPAFNNAIVNALA